MAKNRLFTLFICITLIMVGVFTFGVIIKLSQIILLLLGIITGFVGVLTIYFWIKIKSGVNQEDA